MGASQGNQDLAARRRGAVAPAHTAKGVIISGPVKGAEGRGIPEVNIRATTWTRESHGLYDFEGTETERKQFKIKGNHRVFRVESDVRMELVEDDRFEPAEKLLEEKMRDKIVARLLHQDGSYWVYHKNYVDEGIDQVREKKPEEKIWRVVRETRCPEMEIPCYRLMKKDLIKVGRVRFKIRDIMSPVYRDIEMKHEYFNEHHREMYPSVIDESQ